MSLEADIQEILRAESFSFRPLDEEGWVVDFEAGGNRASVLVAMPSDGEYLLLLSNIAAPFQGTSIDDLSQQVLAKLVRTASQVPLAKLLYLEGMARFAVVSECAVEGVNGRKLRRRLEACASLAVRIAAEFPA